MKYVIVGNGVAGLNAALSIRKKDLEGEITLVSESNHLHYYRPKLIDYLSGEISKEKIIIYKDDFYKEKMINNILGTKIESFSLEEKFLLTDKKEKIFYDKLLLALGSSSFVPPINGVQNKGVFTLRGFQDADQILSFCQDVEKVAIIGGGLLGIETGQSLNKIGKKVTIIEFAEYLLPRQLDEKGGKNLQKKLEGKGLNFLTGEKVEQIKSNKEGKVEAVCLASGKEVIAGAVIISAGVRPNVALATQGGLKVEKGIEVNDFLETSAKDIFAAGDVVQFKGNLYGLWSSAQEQGKLAGLNMTGSQEKYLPSPPSTVLKVTGIDLYSSGEINNQEAEEFILEEKDSYAKILVKNDKPLGAIVLGSKEKISLAQKVMRGDSSFKDFIK